MRVMASVLCCIQVMLLARASLARGDESSGSAVRLEWVTAPPAFALAKETVPVRVRATNGTSRDLDLAFALHATGDLAARPALPSPQRVRAHASVELPIDLSANRRGSQTIEVHCVAGSEPVPALRATIDWGPALPELPAWLDEVRAEALGDRFILLQNERIRLVFAEGSTPGWQAALVFIRDANGQPQRAATIRPLLHAILQGDSGASDTTFLPSRSRLNSESDGASVYLGAELERGDTLWRGDVTCLVKRGESEVRVIHRLRAAPRGKLWAFDGLTLRVGEGSFGARKDVALLPGLEWLEGEEVSSDATLVHGSEHERVVPHPLKITVPSVSVQAAGLTVGVLWNPRQLWDGRNAHPSLRFASPNWIEHENDHLIGLFVPSVPDFTSENTSRARAPFLVDQESPLRIESYLYAAADQSVLTPIAAWYRRFGVADSPVVMPTSAMSLNLAVDALQQTLWNPEARGWSSIYGQPAESNPTVMALLRVVADGEVGARRRRDLLAILEQAKQAAIDAHGNRTFAKLRSSALPDWNAPFLFGHLPDALEQMKVSVDMLRRKQRDDGSFVYDGVDTLGQPGSVELGTCAAQVAWLLKFARLTADPAALRAGIAGLEFMNRFTVPRGAQSWEVPLRTPDVLAAAQAVSSYLEGHRLTGDERYVRRAAWFAWASLPFLYSWYDEDRPVMLGASIPVFGATRYNFAWFATAVQWNGLVLAQTLRDLAPLDHTFPWLKLARLIVRSAQLQQYRDGKYRGLLPDAFSLIQNQPRGTMTISPEPLLANLLEDSQRDLFVDTELLTTSVGRAHISTVGTIARAREENRSLRFDLKCPGVGSMHVLIAGVPVRQILKDGRLLPTADSLESVREAWQMTRFGAVLKVERATPSMTITAELAEATPEGRESR